MCSVAMGGLLANLGGVDLDRYAGISRIWGTRGRAYCTTLTVLCNEILKNKVYLLRTRHYQYLSYNIAITFTSMHPKADARFLLRMRKMEYKPLSQTRKARR